MISGNKTVYSEEALKNSASTGLMYGAAMHKAPPSFEEFFSSLKDFLPVLPDEDFLGNSMGEKND